MYIIHKKTD